MKRNNKKKAKLVLLVLIVCITLAYAALRTGLNINGTANISSNSWNVHFENYQNSNNTNITPTTEPAITGTTTTTITYVVDLEQPGDLYEFTVDVVNGGSIDAAISVVSNLGGNPIGTGNTVPEYIDYVVSDNNGDALVDGHRLNHGNSEVVKVKVAYKTDIDASQLPSTNQQLSFSLVLTATQAEREVDPFQLTPGVYTTSFYDGGQRNIGIGEVLPEEVVISNTVEGALSQWGGSWGASLTGVDYLADNGLPPIYLKLVLGQNQVVEQGYIEFEVTNEMVQGDSLVTAGTYELRGGVDESSLTSANKTIYNKNKMVLDRALGASNCQESDQGGEYLLYECSPANTSLYVGLHDNGELAVGGAGDYSKCYVDLPHDETPASLACYG